jgi:hypothetical protein
MFVKILLSVLVLVGSALGVALSIYVLAWQTLGTSSYDFLPWVLVGVWGVMLVLAVRLIWQGKPWRGVYLALLVFPLTCILSQVLIWLIRNLE